MFLSAWRIVCMSSIWWAGAPATHFAYPMIERKITPNAPKLLKSIKNGTLPILFNAPLESHGQNLFPPFPPPKQYSVQLLSFLRTLNIPLEICLIAVKLSRWDLIFIHELKLEPSLYWIYSCWMTNLRIEIFTSFQIYSSGMEYFCHIRWYPSPPLEFSQLTDCHPPYVSCSDTLVNADGIIR